MHGLTALLVGGALNAGVSLDAVLRGIAAHLIAATALAVFVFATAAGAQATCARAARAEAVHAGLGRAAGAARRHHDGVADCAADDFRLARRARWPAWAAFASTGSSTRRRSGSWACTKRSADRRCRSCTRWPQSPSPRSALTLGDRRSSRIRSRAGACCWRPFKAVPRCRSPGSRRLICDAAGAALARARRRGRRFSSRSRRSAG